MKVQITQGDNAAVIISRKKNAEDEKFDEVLRSLGEKHPEDFESVTLFWEHRAMRARNG